MIFIVLMHFSTQVLGCFRLFCGQKKIENSWKNLMNCTFPFAYISILEFSESVLALYHMVGFSIAS